MTKLVRLLLFALPLLLSLTSLLPLPCNAFSADRPTDRRLLVLVDDLAIRSSHSRFFSSLQARGYDLDFRHADDPGLALRRYGQYLYDGLILFSPSVQRKYLLPSLICLQVLAIVFLRCRYANRPLSGGTAKNRPSAVDFGRQRPIEGEKGKKKKKRKRRKKRGEDTVLARALSPPSPVRRRR
ncbi:hypothetical protein B296_00036185, partial [Ensete ventricosum]